MIRILFGLLAGFALATPASADDLAAALALPVASELTGAPDRARFAWVVAEAGARNIWIADKGTPARRVTAFTQDDGLELYDLAFTRDGSALAYARGGDAEFPDDRIPNAGLQPIPPEQHVWLDTLDGAPPVEIGQGHGTKIRIALAPPPSFRGRPQA